jgi:hypothetical protein
MSSKRVRYGPSPSDSELSLGVQFRLDAGIAELLIAAKGADVRRNERLHAMPEPACGLAERYSGAEPSRGRSMSAVVHAKGGVTDRRKRPSPRSSQFDWLGRGIPYIKLGRLIRFDPGEVGRWLERSCVEELVPVPRHVRLR